MSKPTKTPKPVTRDDINQGYALLGQLAKRVDQVHGEANCLLVAGECQLAINREVGKRLDTLQRDMQERVAAMDDRYNGLGGAVDDLIKRADALNARQDLLADTLKKIGKLDADIDECVRLRLEALEATQDAMIQPKPAPWYTRAWQSLCGFGRFLRDAYREEVAELPDFNVTHPMTKGKSEVQCWRAGCTNRADESGVYCQEHGIADEKLWGRDDTVSAINTNGETQPCPTDSVCADLQTVHICNPTEFKAWQQFTSTWTPCPTCHDTDPLCTSVGAPHGNNDPIQPSVIFYEGGAAKPADATAEVNRLAREICDLVDALNNVTARHDFDWGDYHRMMAEYREAKRWEGK
jgi:hypothetical protein